MIIDNTITTLDKVDFTLGHVIIVNKELRWTSFDAVNKIRYMLRNAQNIRKLKVGHGGTLDPLATGVLVIGVGAETKNLMTYQNQTKAYIAKITFGATTASYDLESELEGNFPTNHITEKSIQDALDSKFSGTIEQMPPIFSAKSVHGVRSYEAARKGEAIELTPQQITIYKSELLSFSNNTAEVYIECSKGTYIRSIAYDLGNALESGAHLSQLTRTKSGGFSIEQSITIEHLATLLTENIN